MKIEKRIRDGVTVSVRNSIARVSWALLAVAMREAVQQLLADGVEKILIHLEGVTTIDSSGVGELVSAFTTVTNRGGKLKLVNLPPKVNDILQITQLITVFEVYDNEDEALASF